MMLWLLMMMLCSATAVAVAVPLIRRFDATPSGDLNNLAIYQDQLLEIDRDLQAGTINVPEAAASKIEIQRRLAQAQKNLRTGNPISKKQRTIFAALGPAVVIVGGISLYGLLGHPDQIQMNSMVAKLQTHLKDTPNDAEGWRMLGLAQFDGQNYKDSAAAYAKALSLDPQNSSYKSAYAESLVMIARGLVTPEAKTLFFEVLAKDPKEARARFYDALAQEQAGDQSGALIKWQALLADAPAGAVWRDTVQQHITDLKPLAPQISSDQKAQVQAMSPADQNAMIASMVEKLANKLAANPDNVEGWINLMKAYTVLARPEDAKSALTKALATFANDATKTAQISAAAKALHLK